MPNHVGAMLNSGKVVLVTGDIMKSNLGNRGGFAASHSK